MSYDGLTLVCVRVHVRPLKRLLPFFFSSFIYICFLHLLNCVRKITDSLLLNEISRQLLTFLIISIRKYRFIFKSYKTSLISSDVRYIKSIRIDYIYFAVTCEFTDETVAPTLPLEQFDGSIARGTACIQGLRKNYYFNLLLDNAIIH